MSSGRKLSEVIPIDVSPENVLGLGLFYAKAPIAQGGSNIAHDQEAQGPPSP